MNYAEGVVGASSILDVLFVSGYEAGQIHRMKSM
jgi:hypothetical protein